MELTEEGIALAEMALETNDLWDENDPWARWTISCAVALGSVLSIFIIDRKLRLLYPICSLQKYQSLFELFSQFYKSILPLFILSYVKLLYCLSHFLKSSECVCNPGDNIICALTLEMISQVNATYFPLSTYCHWNIADLLWMLWKLKSSIDEMFNT